jgi:hypothetical protein
MDDNSIAHLMEFTANAYKNPGESINDYKEAIPR